LKHNSCAQRRRCGIPPYRQGKFTGRESVAFRDGDVCKAVITERANPSTS